MTRHEAKTILQVSGFDEYSADLWLKRYVALGMLKLDEPKSAREKLIAKACSIGGIKAKDWNKVEHGLSLAGLKIVEK